MEREWRRDSERLHSASASVINFKSFFSELQRKENHLNKALKKDGQMKALYSWERDYLEGSH